MADREKDNQKNNQKEKDDGQKSHGKNALEWLVFGASSLLVAAIMSFLIYQTLTETKLPPRLEVTLGEPVKAGKRMLVPVTVSNRGDATAAGVEVEVRKGKSKEAANFALPYVPRSGKRNGWVAFDAPVRKEELEANILGYEES